MTWSAERTETLKRLWAEGWSASQVAARLGVTRGAVTGRIHRLGLVGRASASRAATIGRRTAEARAPRPAAHDAPGAPQGPSMPLPAAQPDDVARVSVMDLEPYHCRWIPGDPVEIGAYAPLFCGLARSPGSSYCATHHARAVNPVLLRPVRVVERNVVARRELATTDG
jgi:GcrA cell cycle regulator